MVTLYKLYDASSQDPLAEVTYKREGSDGAKPLVRLFFLYKPYELC